MSRILLSLFAVTVTITAAGAVAAQEAQPAAVAPATPKVSQVLHDAKGRRLGAIDDIQADTVSVIMDMRVYHIPRSTLRSTDKGLQTSLTRAEIH